MNLKKLRQTLSEVSGPSGHESPIAQILSTTWSEYADEMRSDAMGNLIAVKKGEGDGPRPRVLLAAHMDEIALLVTNILAYPDENGSGFLRVSKVGGVDTRQTYAQQVVVHGQRDCPV